MFPAFWNICSAARVLGPMIPSIGPGSWPLSLSASWMAVTCLAPLPAGGDPAPQGDPVEVLALVSDFEVS